MSWPVNIPQPRHAHDCPGCCLAISRRMFFWIFPVEVFGSSQNSKRLGTLYRARRSRANSASVSASTSDFLSVTKATGTSPQRSSGIPTTALSTTEG